LIQIKICCISNLSEALLAQQAGASMLGLVSAMPSGPGVIGENEIKSILDGISSPAKTSLLTSKVSAESIIEQYQKMPTTAIQLVDYLVIEELKILRARLPKVELVQVVHVESKDSIDLARSYEPFVDIILLDSGKPQAKTKILGGTGETHNWDISADIVMQLDKPVFLAGGLNPENVQSAIAKVKPFGIDVCSGVRTDGKLDDQKLQAFIQQINH